MKQRTRQHDVGIQLFADVDVALHDGVVGGLVHTIILLADQRGLEQHLGTAEALVANCDNLESRKKTR
jgi:hypothetical protein